MVEADQVQAQVDAGRAARGGQNAAVVDEQDVRIDLDLGEEPRQRVAQRPVRGGPAAVQ